MLLIKKIEDNFIDRVLSIYNTSNNPLWAYEVISARLYVKHLIRHQHVQCYLGSNYVLYELNGDLLSYKVRKDFNEKYGEPVGKVELPKLFREVNLVFLLLIHKKLVESKYGL